MQQSKELQQSDYVVQIAKSQLGATRLRLQAEGAKQGGDLRGAAAAFEQLIERFGTQLELMLEYNQRYAPSYDIAATANILVNDLLVRADVLEASGEYEEGLRARTRARELAEKHAGEAAVLEVVRSNASALQARGDFNEALASLRGLRRYLEEKGSRLKSTRAALDMVDVLHWLADLERAKEELAEARRIFAGTRPSGIEEEFEAMRIRTELIFYAGLLAKSSGDFELAEKAFREALPQYEKLGGAVGVEFQLASIAVLTGRYTEGLEELERIEPLFRGLARQKLGVLFSYRARALLELGRSKDGERTAEQAVTELRKFQDLDSLWRAQWVRAQALRALNDEESSLAVYLDAVATVNDLRRRSLGYRLNNTYLSDKLPMFEEAICLAADLGNAEACLRAIEAVKSHALTAILRMGQAPPDQEMRSLQERFDELTRRLDGLDAPVESNARAGTDELSLRKERRELFEEMRLRNPRGKNLSQVATFELDAIRETLARHKACLLNLFWIDGDAESGRNARIVTVIVDAESETVESLQPSEDTLERVAAYDANLQRAQKPSAEERPYAFEFDASDGLDLIAEELVPEVFWERALKHERLLIAPHRKLHLLPWAGLRFRDSRLFESTAVGVLPNASTVPALDGPPNPEPFAAFIGAVPGGGDDLPGARRALLDTSKWYEARDRLVSSPRFGTGATTGAFWALAEHERSAGALLHVGCHGDFDTEDPMDSALILADGRITAGSLILRRLAFSELLLPACSTGYRPVRVGDVRLIGDDVLGLPGAALEAGARSVLVSIPPSQDHATAAFMQKYHEQRRSEASPLLAFRATQQEMDIAGVHSPYEWIGLTMYGLD